MLKRYRVTLTQDIIVDDDGSLDEYSDIKDSLIVGYADENSDLSDVDIDYIPDSAEGCKADVIIKEGKFEYRED